MANPEKGEVAFEHEGQTYTLVTNMNAVAKWQALYNTTDSHGRLQVVPLDELNRLVRDSVEHQIGFFWAGLQKYHSPQFQTCDQAGDLLDRAGAVAVAAMFRAAGFGDIDPKDLEELAKGNPRPAQVRPIRKDGTGGKRSSRRAPAA